MQKYIMQKERPNFNSTADKFLTNKKNVMECHEQHRFAPESDLDIQKFFIQISKDLGPV